MTAVDLAARLARKEVSAREVMAAHLAQIERVNPKVNAIVTLVAERAMADAAKGRRGDGARRSARCAARTAGRAQGSRRHGRHSHDAWIAVLPRPRADRGRAHRERIRAAGAITVGKTNTPEFGAGSQTFNTVFGATRNPYDLTKTCGGSSGGAAVAAGAAAWCRSPTAATPAARSAIPPPSATSSGLRPSPGRVPSETASWSPLSRLGPMARTVADVALFLSAIAGPDRAQPAVDRRRTRRAFRAPLGRDFKGVRVAWWQRTRRHSRSSRRFAASSTRNRQVFEDLGCVVEEAEPDFTGVDEAFPTLRFAANHSQLRAARASSARSG